VNQLLQWLSDLFHGARVWTIVQPWERGLRVRLGRWHRMWEPGFHWRIPFADHVRVINTRLRLAPVPCVTITTKDGKTVTAAGTVGFRIADPYRALLTVQHPEAAASAFAQAALAEYVAARRAEDLTVVELQELALDTLRKSDLEGPFEFTLVRVSDFAIVRTLRLLQEQWRPSSEFSNFDPEKK
jgi:SPFH domain/Band 7 family protein